MTRKQASGHTGLSARTLSRYVEKGILRQYRLGVGGVRYRKSDLDKLLREDDRYGKSEQCDKPNGKQRRRGKPNGKQRRRDKPNHEQE